MAARKTKRDESEESNLPVAAAPGGYAVQQYDPEVILETVRANLGGEMLSPMDFDRITVPAGGGTTWTVPTIEGDTDEKEIVGVIVAQNLQRTYWKERLDVSGGGTPPDCYADDSAMGHGDPGGPCEACPLAQFGTAVGADGKLTDGQACRQTRVLFMLREGDMLPIVVTVPPSSLKDSKKFLFRLSSRGVPYYGVETKLSLTKDKSGGGITYSKIEFGVAKILDAALAERMRAYAVAISPALKRVRFTEDAQRSSA